VLVVDDDPAIRRLVDGVLSAVAVGEVRHVDSGRAALEHAGQADVILLDQHLPDMPGLAVLEAVRARGVDASVVLMTAHGDASLVATALRHGADDYLAKDAALAEMLPEVLERVRRLRGLRAALAAAERDLVRVERLAAIGEVTVTVHHEVNNPLMAAFTELALLRETSLTEAQLEGIDNVGAALERIRDIVGRLRDLRRAERTDYLNGITMLELPRTDEPAIREAERGAAVLLAPGEELARVTALLLRRAGFSVERARDPGDLGRRAERAGVAMVVIAGESATTGGDPLAGFRPAARREHVVVALVRPDNVEAARSAGADHVITLPFDPATFAAELAAVRRPT
jgi:DNA-binding response OmpR family regulator